jgi:hypothetical protein
MGLPSFLDYLIPPCSELREKALFSVFFVKNSVITSLSISQRRPADAGHSPQDWKVVQKTLEFLNACGSAGEVRMGLASAATARPENEPKSSAAQSVGQWKKSN